ncbi:hypothetical protein [Vibrio cidicii]
MSISLTRPIRDKKNELLDDKAQLINIMAEGSQLAKEKTERGYTF